MAINDILNGASNGSRNGSNGVSSAFPALSVTEYISQADEAKVIIRPSEIPEGNLYGEREYDALKAEQRPHHEALAAAETKPLKRKANSLKVDAEAAIKESIRNQVQADVALKLYMAACAALEKERRRPTDAKPLKWVRWGLLFGGDICAIGMPALMLGEPTVTAFAQATSVGISIITLGAVGREVRYAKSKRERQKKKLSKDEKQFESFFSGPDSGEFILKALLGVCTAGAALIGGGIFALRDATEGLAAGAVFGCFALALGLASFYNSFDTADDVAEFLDAQKKELDFVEKRGVESREHPVIKEYNGTLAEIESIEEYHRKAAEAAEQAVDRLKFQMLGKSAGVAGHGCGSKPVNGNGAGA